MSEPDTLHQTRGAATLCAAKQTRSIETHVRASTTNRNDGMACAVQSNAKQKAFPAHGVLTRRWRVFGFA
eukprot:866918-Rhodomonas_salina.4